MRCGCPHCDTFMIQEEDSQSACVCPNCGYRCNACLGTGSAITREDLEKLRNTEWFTPMFDGAPDDEPSANQPLSPEPPDAPSKF